MFTNNVHIDTPCISFVITQLNENFYYFEATFNEKIVNEITISKASKKGGAKNLLEHRGLQPPHSSSSTANTKYKILSVKGTVVVIHRKIDAVLLSYSLIKINDNELLIQILNWEALKTIIGSKIKNIINYLSDYKYSYIPRDGNIRTVALFILGLLLTIIKPEYERNIINYIMNNPTDNLEELFNGLCESIIKKKQQLISRDISEDNNSQRLPKEPNIIHQNIEEIGEKETNSEVTSNNPINNDSSKPIPNNLHFKYREHHVQQTHIE